MARNYGIVWFSEIAHVRCGCGGGGGCRCFLLPGVSRFGIVWGPPCFWESVLLCPVQCGPGVAVTDLKPGATYGTAHRPFQDWVGWACRGWDGAVSLLEVVLSVPALQRLSFLIDADHVTGVFLGGGGVGWEGGLSPFNMPPVVGLRFPT